jgi:hypothetical protein
MQNLLLSLLGDAGVDILEEKTRNIRHGDKVEVVICPVHLLHGCMCAYEGAIFLGFVAGTWGSSIDKD